ncbi:MAG: 1,4-alpha-glucan branching enzyme [Nitrospinae bacterium RIFCSPLOWO2_02_FULL_39_110]|nr:MAG: 1,4-alpha-glucan branching enzyme [Nitrospinae bacterium RIFCSPHIGHO2_02_39_11]OGV99502.1 MAG: 1,4-alpha-glucan branching enzyme [Nitrospinae bacterium RIFCSPHIGHO2_12_FULL_39_42]OGW01207.1 MAG: 1,4-alpha-glucan branching enzyme [Nitrospinae bacterium RIFCSPHIGHO2_02_FULL_39_82]OGW01632.1 MAG: 1,4-alpha-glucan branching enzyme [Nitrospinae bacterium RIFCSPLOWO2_02_39_17]OGW05470.1 MAG: 1,4-alpha-glucan branching enzyme [Nitrospinae bacterium RIFCSPLOWO2_02_FULL_39_110]OGW10498.1 MAG: 1
MKTTVGQKEIEKIITANHHDPFQVLGIHQITVDDRRGITIRAFLPEAVEVSAVDSDNQQNIYTLSSIHPDGFFETFIEDRNIFSYQFLIKTRNGNLIKSHDPYSFLPLIGDLDRHLFNEGNHLQIYEKLGAHIMDLDGITGVHFSVWAPNAKRVSVIGDFNRWDGRRHPMRILGNSGIWELFIPGLKEGDIYKFEIKTRHNHLLIKSDPYAFYSEVRPKSASVVWDINKYKWNDSEWLENRDKTTPLNKPLSIYEVHLGSWARKVEENNRFLTYREIAHLLVDYIKNTGYTHIELLPIMEHPFDASWGYQVTGYFAPTSRFGTPEDFMYFIDYCHQNNIGVIVDWVPAHFPRDGHSLIQFDGTALYEHEDPKKGAHPDWGTLIFNYGRHEVRNFLTSNVLFWCKKYHLDGLRVDAVASMLYLDYSKRHGEWVPNTYGGRENLEAIDFLKKMNEVIHAEFPGIMTIAEESTSWGGVSRPTYLGGLGFTFKWNMGWMHDILDFFSKDPIYRKHHHNNLTFAMLYAFHENFILVLSHDEVVHGKASLLSKMPGDFWQKFANLRLLLSYMYAQPGKKLLFMGGDIGQWNEWNHNRSLDWHLLQYEPHSKLQSFIKDLNHLYRSEPAMREVDFEYSGFEWIDFHDWERSIISFIRWGKDPDNHLVFVFNFTPAPRFNYKIGVPSHCFYEEVLNSDSDVYYGSNLGNQGGKWSNQVSWQGKPCSLKITLPPLSAVVFKPVKDEDS